MIVGFLTLGCKVNQYETQAMEAMLGRADTRRFRLIRPRTPMSSTPARSPPPAIKNPGRRSAVPGGAAPAPSLPSAAATPSCFRRRFPRSAWT